MHNSYSCEGEVFFTLCKCVDSPYSLGLWLRYKYGLFDEIALAEFPFEQYTTGDEIAFERDYQVFNFLRKCESLDTSFDRRQVAVQSFRTSESVCLQTNINLDRLYGSKEPSAVILDIAALKIKRILGEFNVSEYKDSVRWGTGASATIRRSNAGVGVRAGELPVRLPRSAFRLFTECFSDDYPFLRAAGLQPDGPASVPMLALDESVFEVVPKDSKTHRGIAKEPTGGMCLQKGVGLMIRRRLKRAGIDLNDQRINRTLASVAHRDGLATIDLSSASDTISYNLVKWLLPDDWFRVIDSIRSSRIKIEGESVLLQKFSSMGNGFTFELESLIFFAIIEALKSFFAVRSLVSVYGDDIIVESHVYPLIAEYFPIFGFKVNTSKSYARGLFYESCGGHYFNGYDVTPAYQREGISDLPAAFRAANRLFRKNLRTCDSSYLLKARHVVIRRFPSDCQLPASVDCDDGYLFNDLRPLRSCPNRGLQVWNLVFTPYVRNVSHCGFTLACGLRWPVDPVNGVLMSVVTGGRGRYRRRKRWYHLGTASISASS